MFQEFRKAEKSVLDDYGNEFERDLKQALRQRHGSNFKSILDQEVRDMEKGLNRLSSQFNNFVNSRERSMKNQNLVRVLDDLLKRFERDCDKTVKEFQRMYDRALKNSNRGRSNFVGRGTGRGADNGRGIENELAALWKDKQLTAKNIDLMYNRMVRRVKDDLHDNSRWKARQSYIDGERNKELQRLHRSRSHDRRYYARQLSNLYTHYMKRFRRQ